MSTLSFWLIQLSRKKKPTSVINNNFQEEDEKQPFADVPQKIGILGNFADFTGKHLFLIKLQAFRHATLLKRGSKTDVFLLNLRNS